MIIHFGMSLAGMQPEPPATAMGEVTLGPARLLDLLELRLGLPHHAQRPGEALLAYRACLADLDHESRFYHRSFAVDSIGVARTLLEWRARWYEAGWRGRFQRAGSPRLADMAAVEAAAEERVPPTAGQRLRRIEEALTGGLAARIERIVLHDEPDDLPLAWRQVLEHFSCEPAPGIAPEVHARRGTDLERVQRALLALDERENGNGQPAKLEGDDSFIVVRGVSRDLTAQTLAEYLLKLGPPDDALVIAQRDGIIVDNALERVGLPRAGFQHYSRFRAVTQALKLCLALIWEPASPELLLQFLLHPVGPLPRFARSALAEAVAAEPGVGGRAWQAALETVAHRQSGAPAGKASASSSNTARLLEEIHYWLDPDRYPPSEGAPVETLVERTQRCTTWLAGRLHGAAEAERDLYAAAHGQGEALIAALASLAGGGQRRVARIQLEQLVDEVTGHSADPGTFAQAGHVPAVTEPATVTRPWDTVIWWDLAAQGLRADYPWPETELEELAANGVALPRPAERIRARARTWRRPILNAREQLVLVVHDREEGHHPLWSQLSSVLTGYAEIRVEEELLGGSRASIPALDVTTEPLALRPLPEPRRWWLLPPHCRIEPRQAESYSSLQKLIDYPHEWVLTYPARLAAGRADNLPGLSLLCGNLAHRVLETYFETFPSGASPSWRDHDEAHLRAWLDVALPKLIAAEGAVLDQPGMGVKRHEVVAAIEHALSRLVRHLRQADVVEVIAERWHEVAFEGIAPGPEGADKRLRGAIDLLLTDARGREIVLDVKWSGEDWRGRELAANRSLQLATYAYMRRAQRGGGHWPEQAYFIVTTGNIVARDSRIFPEAIEWPPEPGEEMGVEEIWKRLCAAHDWRWSQLRAGLIECNTAGTAPDERSAAPEHALAPREEIDNFDAFTWLAGWERGE